MAYGERMVSTTEIRDDGRVRGLILVAAMAAVMWAVEIVDVVAGDLDSAGIRPRDPEGLIGIPLAPVLHGGFGHLIGNTIPFLVLGGLIALSGLARIAAVTVIVALVGGLGTWLVAPANTVHIGASGLVFGFAAYLIARGVLSRRALQLVAGVARRLI
jgi:membrane associated rhomboid family serine protease